MTYARIYLVDGTELSLKFHGEPTGGQSLQSYVAGCLARGDTLSLNPNEARRLDAPDSVELGTPGRPGHDGLSLAIPARQVNYVAWEFE